MSDDVYRVFFETLVKGGVGPIARTAYQLLGRPIAIGDETGAKILQLPEDEIGLPSEGAEFANWNELLRSGTINRDEYLSVHADLAGGAIAYNEPVLVHGRFLSHGNQVITIFERHGSILTFVTVLYGQDAPSEDEMQVIRVFAQALRPEIVRMRQLEKSQERRLGAVLGEIDSASPEYRVAISALQKQYRPDYRLLYIEERSPNEHTVLSRICRSLNAGMLPCVDTLAGELLVVLVHGMSMQPKAMDQLVDLLGRYPVRVSLSTPFDDLPQIRGYRFQAYTTLLAGKNIAPAEWLYRYDDYVPYQMCAATALGGSIDAFVHPAIMRIARHDEEKGSDWLETIEALLYHHLNKGETAKALNIHPNTLAYRLGRIEELFGVDCADPQFMATFYTSAMALRYRGLGV